MLFVARSPRCSRSADVSPARVHAGDPAGSTCAVRNLRRRRTPVLRLRDPVDGTRGADCCSPRSGRGERPGRLPPAHRAPRASCRRPAAGRARRPLRPATAAVAAPALELTVYPAHRPLAPLPLHDGDRTRSPAPSNPTSLGRTGEDFYALRPYVVGDDLRRVHWPSTARHDELMVRQDELPWQGRTTVLLDVRARTRRRRLSGPCRPPPAHRRRVRARDDSAWSPPTAPTPASAPASPTWGDPEYLAAVAIGDARAAEVLGAGQPAGPRR